MELKNIIQPKPARNYTGMELAKAFKIALHNAGITDEEKLRRVIYKKVVEWTPKAQTKERLVQAQGLRDDFGRQTLGWKVFCKAAAVLEQSTDDMLKVLA